MESVLYEERVDMLSMLFNTEKIRVTVLVISWIVVTAQRGPRFLGMYAVRSSRRIIVTVEQGPRFVGMVALHSRRMGGTKKLLSNLHKRK